MVYWRVKIVKNNLFINYTRIAVMRKFVCILAIWQQMQKAKYLEIGHTANEADNADVK